MLFRSRGMGEEVCRRRLGRERRDSVSDAMSVRFAAVWGVSSSSEPEEEEEDEEEG